MSLISSIMLSLSSYVYKKFESRVLVDILCSLGYGVSYDEVKLFLDNILAAPSYVEQLKNLGEGESTQFDNADWNKRNDTGQDSWHVMGGIAVVSPSHIIEDKYKIKRCKTSTPSAGNQFIPIIEAPRATKNLLLPTVLRPLPPTCLSANGSTITDLINL